MKYEQAKKKNKIKTKTKESIVGLMQVVGLLVIYSLFLYDASRDEPWDSLDDVIYYTRAVARCLEFLVAVFVVCAGFHESLVGQWSWSNSAVLVVHCYFNVWQRLQTGWLSYLRRREAAKHIDALPTATEQQLAEHNDVCAICYQAMSSSSSTVRVTFCRHLFHGSCLRKWLYVQEKCPMCSTPITTTSTGPSAPPTSPPPPAATPSAAPSAVPSTGPSASHPAAASDRKVHFDLMETPSASEDPVSPSSSTQSFDDLVHMAKRDVRLANLRGRQARHSRSKSESLAQILE